MYIKHTCIDRYMNLPLSLYAHAHLYIYRSIDLSICVSL